MHGLHCLKICNVLLHVALLCGHAGQFDAQDGPGSVEAWTTNLDWPVRFEFYRAKRHIWRLHRDLSSLMESDASTALETASAGHVTPVAGYVKHHNFLTSVVLKDAGHMVPRDQPLVAQAMIEGWVQHCLKRTMQPSPEALFE